MNEQAAELDIHFYQLVLSMQANAWTQMGKTASPITGKVERNMDQAKLSIDMLEMIQRKTEGNLSDDEKTLIQNALYQLRMNYVEEVNKDKAEASESEEGSKADSEPSNGSEEKPDAEPSKDEGDKPE